MNKVVGLENILKNINASIKRVKKQTEKGVQGAGKIVFRASQKKVPVDFGFLKASASIRNGKLFSKYWTSIGYSASYALYVHENLNAKHGSSRVPFKRRGRIVGPGGIGQEAKFLENAVKENKRKILRFIKDSI